MGGRHYNHGMGEPLESGFPAPGDLRAVHGRLALRCAEGRHTLATVPAGRELVVGGETYPTGTRYCPICGRIYSESHGWESEDA